MLKPGDVYWADLPEGRHPLIVVSREELNKGNTVSAVLVTSAHFARRSKLPNCVPLRGGEHGFTVDCVAQCETAGPIHQSEIDVQNGRIGKLPDQVMRDIIKAIGYVLDADCEPA